MEFDNEQICLQSIRMSHKNSALLTTVAQARTIKICRENFHFCISLQPAFLYEHRLVNFFCRLSKHIDDVSFIIVGLVTGDRDCCYDRAISVMDANRQAKKSVCDFLNITGKTLFLY